MMRFEFATANRIIFAQGALQNLTQIIPQYGRHVFIVCGMRDLALEKVLAVLPSDALWQQFRVAHEPDVATIQAGLQLARSQPCDVVIAVGGGSVLDAGKAIAAMLTNPGDLLDYLEVVGKGKMIAVRPMPLIAVPTTAGTGSEVTRNAVINIPDAQVKVSLRSALMIPEVALIDPQLTISMPPAITASTGMDALTQVIEAYVCTGANPMTDGYAREGIRRARASLRRAYTDGNDLAAREDMCITSLMGGITLANAGLGAVHGFAGVIGSAFDAPHGAVCARLLPFVMRANVDMLIKSSGSGNALWKYEDIAELLTGDAQSSIGDAIEWLLSLLESMKIPTLRHYGISQQHYDDIVRKAKNASSMKKNPVVLPDDRLRSILEEAV